MYVGTALEMRILPISGALVSLWHGDYEGLWFPSSYLSFPKQNSSHIFLLFPEFLFLSWTLFSSYWTPSFQCCVKCDWKLNYFGLWHCSWFPQNGMGKFALFPLVSCLLTTSVFCAVPRTKLVNDFFLRDIGFALPLWINNTTALYDEKNFSWIVGKQTFQFGPCCW